LTKYSIGNKIIEKRVIKQKEERVYNFVTVRVQNMVLSIKLRGGEVIQRHTVI